MIEQDQTQSHIQYLHQQPQNTHYHHKPQSSLSSKTFQNNFLQNFSDLFERSLSQFVILSHQYFYGKGQADILFDHFKGKGINTISYSIRNHPSYITNYSQLISILNGQKQPPQYLLLDIYLAENHKITPILQALNTRKAQNIKKTIIYCHNHQQNMVKQLLQDAQIVKYGYQFPYEISNGDLIQQLINFVKLSPQISQKHDIVIFNHNDSFIKKVEHTLIYHNLYHNCKIVTENNLIQSNKQSQTNLTHIFIVPNTQKLIELTLIGYNIDHVYLVLDSCLDSILYYDYLQQCFVQFYGKPTYDEQYKRINLINGKIGQYMHTPEIDPFNIQEFQQNRVCHDQGIQELLYDMLKLKRAQKNSQKSQNIHNYIKDLQKLPDNFLNKILSSNSYLIFNHLFYKLKTSNNKTHILDLDNWLCLAAAIMVSPDLQQMHTTTKQSYQIQHKKQIKIPVSVWNKTGYLQSCINFVHLVKCLLQRQQNYTLKQLAQKYQFNIDAYQRIIYNYKQFLKYYEVDKTELPQDQIDEQLFEHILSNLIDHQPKSVRLFSGSKRLGYLQKGSQKGILLNSNSLTQQLNQKPSFIFVTRMIFDSNKSQNSLSIIHSNNISDQIMIHTCGSLGNYSKTSFGECQIEFNQIPTSIIKRLTQYNGIQVQNFQKQYECSLEINESMNLIVAQCSKTRQQVIRKNLKKMIEQIRNSFQQQTNNMNYLPHITASIKAGGQIDQIFINYKDNEIFTKDKGLLVNLSKQVTLQNLKDLIDEFIQLKNISLYEKQETKEAILQFYSPQDFQKFTMYFDGCQYFGTKMYLHAYKPKNKTINHQNYLILSWNVWPSTGNGYIQFRDHTSAKQALDFIKQLDQFDGNKISVKLSQNKLFFSNLHPYTDQNYLRANFTRFGTIVSVEIIRKKVYNKKQLDRDVYGIINSALLPYKKQKLVFKAMNVVKGKNGYREIKVIFQRGYYITTGFIALDQKINYLGIGRLNAIPYFTLPIRVPQNNILYINVYISILQQISQQLKRSQMFQYQIQNQVQGSWIIVKANQQQEVKIVQKMFDKKLKNRKLVLKPQEIRLLLSDYEYENLLELQKNYPCKITVNMQEKCIHFMGGDHIFNLVSKQINTKIYNSFICRIKLHKKPFKHFKNNPQLLRKQKGLKKLYLDKLTKQILIVGPLDVVAQKKKCIVEKIKYLVNNGRYQQQQQNQCGLCADDFQYPYKLLGCGHKFCFNCLQQATKIACRDLTMYPLKCPQCLESIIISDLYSILSNEDWKKVLDLSVNSLVSKKGEKYMFCLTPQCPNIMQTGYKSEISCKICKKSFCMMCKSISHPKMSCQQARFGSDRLFKEFLKQVDGRICPNTSCKAPLWRISGCYKVLCVKCKKSLCFKCPADKMQVFDTPDKAYSHLNRVHGGCF